MAEFLMAARRGFLMANLLERVIASSPARSAAAASSHAARSFNTNAEMRDAGFEERSMDVDRSGEERVVRRRGDGDLPSLFSDVLDPWSPTRSLSQMLNMMDQMFVNPFALSGRGSSVGRRGWDAREDDDALYLRVDMPGLSKEQVRVSAEQGTLIIKGEGEKEWEEESGQRYGCRIDLPDELYRMDQIKAEMKNGVLKVVVPKVKTEERKDVHHVNVE